MGRKRQRILRGLPVSTAIRDSLVGVKNFQGVSRAPLGLRAQDLQRAVPCDSLQACRVTGHVSGQL